jgi:hypothetical protein
MSVDLLQKVLADLGYEIHMGIECSCGAVVYVDNFKEPFVCSKCGKKYYNYKGELVKK